MRINLKKQCFGSLLEIHGESQENINSVITESFSYIDDFEQKYSRFISGNWLSKLNKGKKAWLTKEIKAIIELSLKVSHQTEGYYDITILPLLENAGYGIQKKKIPENIGYKNIVIHGDMIILWWNVSLEFGSFGKWYIVDYLYRLLEKHFKFWVINFGGDMRVIGEKDIHLENPVKLWEYIGKTSLKNMSIASSAGNRRKLQKGTHLQFHKKVRQWERVQATYITHQLCTMADIYSTALFVCPFQKAVHILETTHWLEWMIISETGEIYTSTHFDYYPQ